MKNVRLEDGDLVYDCSATNCETPGVPHRVPVNQVMASLDATYSQFVYDRDPRLEEIAVLLNYFWRLLYPEGQDGCEIPEKAPWMSDLKDILSQIADKYTPKPKKLPKKKPTLLN